MIAPLLGLPRQSEILIIIFLGICFLSLDFSLFELKSNLEEIWNLELNKTKSLETLIKYIISAVLLSRTLTLHAFLAFYIIMLWPAIFEEKPNLMLPWLLLGIMRCLIMNAVTFVVGSFICHKEKGLSRICLEYVLAQVIEHGPSVYAWISVLSFYRELAGEHHPSEESLLSNREKSVDNISKEENDDSEDGLEKSKSYSMSDINLDYMQSSQYRALSADSPIQEMLTELKRIVTNTKLVRDSSNSFDSVSRDGGRKLITFESFTGENLTYIEKTMRVLNVSQQDVADARKDKNKLSRILKEVQLEDVSKIGERSSTKVTSVSFYSKKGHVHKGVKSYIPKSVSFFEEGKNQVSCLCYLRRKLQEENSKLTLIESEIANINFDEIDVYENQIVEDSQLGSCGARNQSYSCKVGKNTGMNENFDNNDIPNALNKYRVVVGASLGLNKDNFLQKFALKKNTSKNFGCQVSMLRRNFLLESKSELARKWEFLRNFRLL